MKRLLPLFLLFSSLPAFAQLQLEWTEIDQLAWSDLGPNQAYLIEWRDELNSGPDWASTIAVDAVPGTNLTANVAWSEDRGFFRVKAMPRGTLVAAESVASYNRLTLQFILAEAGVPISPDFGAQLFKLEYQTLGPRNETTIASGIVAVPTGAAGARPLASIQRPTILQRSEAPTESTIQQLQAAAMASLGYVVALPDLLGFGDAPGLHPYVHTKTSGTAVVDMLRATKSWAALAGQDLNDQLFLAGYSQGGHGTMAAHRMLEELHADEFTVTASAPMAGPYDLSGTMFDLIIAGQPFDTPYYLPYLMFGYDEVYGFMTNDSDTLQSPYDTTLRPLFNGANSGDTINAAMPASQVPADILQPAFRAAIAADPQHPFHQMLVRNDLVDWLPLAPMRMLHCRGDTTVPIGNTDVAYAQFLANGATTVTRGTPDAAPAAPLGHSDCAIPALLDALNWFEGF